MAQLMANRTPRFLYPLPKVTDRITASGRKIVEPNVDWFVRETAGLDFDGLTVRERQERNAKRNRVIKDALIILAAVGLLVAVWIF